MEVAATDCGMTPRRRRRVHCALGTAAATTTPQRRVGVWVRSDIARFGRQLSLLEIQATDTRGPATGCG
jgi:hypothetical protein